MLGWEPNGNALAAVQNHGGAFLWFPSKPDSVQQWEVRGLHLVPSQTPCSSGACPAYGAADAFRRGRHSGQHLWQSATAILPSIWGGMVCSSRTTHYSHVTPYYFLGHAVLFTVDEEFRAQAELTLQYLLRVLVLRFQACVGAARRQFCGLGPKV